MTITTADTSTKVCTFSIQADELARIIGNASLASSKDSTLPILNTVRLELADGGLRAVATDRYRLFIDSAELIDTAATDSATFSLHLPDATALCKILKGEKSLSVSVTIADNALHVQAGSTSVRYTAVDGDFPRYGTLVPSKDAGEVSAPFGLNPQLLAALSKVVTVQQYSRRSSAATVCTFTMTSPTKPIRVDIGETFHGCIMPIRL